MRMINDDLLSVNKKAEILWNEGRLIEAFELNDFDISLFLLDNEYFEIYHSVAENKIERISVLNDPLRLRKYTGRN